MLRARWPNGVAFCSPYRRMIPWEFKAGTVVEYIWKQTSKEHARRKGEGNPEELGEVPVVGTLKSPIVQRNDRDCRLGGRKGEKCG